MFYSLKSSEKFNNLRNQHWLNHNFYQFNKYQLTHSFNYNHRLGVTCLILLLQGRYEEKNQASRGSHSKYTSGSDCTLFIKKALMKICVRNKTLTTLLVGWPLIIFWK